jgi:hypothetical protein
MAVRVPKLAVVVLCKGRSHIINVSDLKDLGQPKTDGDLVDEEILREINEAGLNFLLDVGSNWERSLEQYYGV